MGFLFVLAGLGAVLGGFTLFAGMLLTKSAPQEAASAAMAVGFAVVPYVLARAVQLYLAAEQAKKHNADVLDRLDRLCRSQDQSNSMPLTAPSSAPADPPAKPFKAESVWNGLG